MENVILVDCNVPSDWSFHKALEQSTGKKWSIIKFVSNMNHGGKLQTILRYCKYFALPIKILIKKNQVNTVLAWQQFFGIVLAFYLKLFRVKSAPEIYIITFIYKDKKSLIGKIYKLFINYALDPKYIKKCICFSKSEADYYKLLFDKNSFFVSTSLGIEDMYSVYASKIENGCFYLAAGRSNRDYDFLKKVWTNRDEHLKIICDTYKAPNQHNITYLTNCYDHEYYTELARCTAVIIPLQDEHISSGQLVILQAMMLGKPIIVTKNDTVTEYIAHLQNGIIISKNAEELFAALAYLKEPKHYSRLSTNSRQSFVERFPLYKMGLRIGEIIQQ